MRRKGWHKAKPALLPLAISAIAAAIAVACAGGQSEQATREETPSPAETMASVTGDHWHATYDVIICGQEQPPIPALHNPEGVHTHGDGIIHMHPFIPSAEGAGARVQKFFEYMGGKLTEDEIQIPGQAETYRNGDLCPDGQEGFVQLFANGQSVDIDRYIPKDGDRVRIVFGPKE